MYIIHLVTVDSIIERVYQNKWEEEAGWLLALAHVLASNLWFKVLLHLLCYLAKICGLFLIEP